MSVTAETPARSVGTHVFISYSATDKAVAEAICAKLEGGGVRCWMAPRDIVPGVIWGEAIIDAITTSRVMILVFSRAANASPQVTREVERAVNRGVPLLPVRIESIPPSKALELYLSTSHWMDAFPPPLETHLEHLLKSVRRLLGPGAPRPSRPSVPPVEVARAPAPSPPEAEAPRDSMSVRLRAAARSLTRFRIAVIVLGVLFVSAAALLARNATKHPPILAITTPEPIERSVGDTLTLGATLDGQPPSASAALRWASNDTTIVRVGATDGVLTAVAPGATMVYAEAAGVRASVRASITSRAPVVSAESTARTPAPVVSAEPTARTPVRNPLPRPIGSAGGKKKAAEQPTGRASSAAAEQSTGRASSAAAETMPDAGVMRGLADECISALRKPDPTWVTEHYAALAAVGEANLRDLRALMSKRGYAAVVASGPTVVNKSAVFGMRFTYQTSFGTTRPTEASFRLEAALSGAQWTIESCRVVGTLAPP